MHLSLLSTTRPIWSSSTPEAEEKAAQKAKAHEEAEKVKAEAKEKLNKMLDQVEKLAD